MSGETLSFLGPEAAAASPADATVIVLPVPYEETVCWKGGTSRGPSAILEASPHLEFYDEQLHLEPWEAGIWTAPPMDFPDRSPRQVVDRVAGRFGQLLDAGKWVMMLGGEHSITPGGVRAVAARREGLVVVQLDAHADLREDWEGERFSHACAMARCVDLAPIRAVGIRSYTRGEKQRIGEELKDYRIVHAWEMERDDWHERILEGLEDRPVYLTFDVDYFDPSIMPSTGTPEPGGGFWYPTLEFLERLFARARVVAADVVELAPRDGLHHADFTAARLVHKLIGMHLKFPA